MENLSEKIGRLKRDVIELKSIANTTGDSAVAYQESYDLGSYPRNNYQEYYVWDFYFAPKANAENFILCPLITECWGYYSDSYGKNLYPTFSRCNGGPDINNPNHIIIAISYLPASGYTVNGNITLTVAANAPFELISSSKQTKTME